MGSLEQIQAGCLACTDCGLAHRRRSVVFGEGNPVAPLVIVGEGPGDEEDKTGRPFVGRAGKLLDQALGDNGLDRSKVYICNTLKCRAADWATGKPQNRPPMPAEVAACRRWLVPQLSAIAPEIVLCVGAPSAKNLIRADFKITKERGILFKSDYARATLATLHPAYILRNQGQTSDGGYGLLVQDVAKAWENATRLREKFGEPHR